jgi:FkbM family methyltransferase
LRDARLRLLRDREVKVVLDVGANAGQYASRLREDGYEGLILSFEPLAEAYQRLEAAATDDPKWHTVRVALAEEAGTAAIHVSANSHSSSFLPITNRCVDAAPDAAYVRTELVDVTALDLLTLPPGAAMLKIDLQGTEPSVLRGARKLLRRVEVLELELSLVTLYDGKDVAPAVCQMLRTERFVPLALDVAFTDPITGEILQLDGLFASTYRSD